MTLVDQRATEVTSPPHSLPPSPPAPVLVRPRMLIAMAVAVLVASLVAAWVFEDPVAHLWYEARQQRLALDFRAQRETIKPGQAVATLQIPTIRLNLTIGEGDSANQLRAGPGHRPGTALPGQPGNSVVYGHRNGWGAPFANLGRLRVGDAIDVQNRARSTFEYQVTGIQHVSDGDGKLIGPSTGYRLTLITGSDGRLGSGVLVVSAISGAAGKLLPTRAHPRMMPPRGDVLLNWTVVSLVLRLAVAAGLIVLLRRRHRPRTVAIVVFPVALAALLALLVDLDLLLSPVG